MLAAPGQPPVTEMGDFRISAAVLGVGGGVEGVGWHCWRRAGCVGDDQCLRRGVDTQRATNSTPLNIKSVCALVLQKIKNIFQASGRNSHSKFDLSI